MRKRIRLTAVAVAALVVQLAPALCNQYVTKPATQAFVEQRRAVYAASIRAGPSGTQHFTKRLPCNASAWRARTAQTMDANSAV